jgi:hypothetical protein
MKREEKSNNVKKRILEASRRLLVTQGYTKTTIRQITEEAGVNIGTVYHFFRNKEEIFFNQAKITDKEIMNLARHFTYDKGNYVLQYALYRAFEFKMIEGSDILAELYLHSYSSWKLTERMISRNIRRKKLYFKEYIENFTKQDLYKKCMALRGMRLMFMSERVHTGINKFEEYTPFIINTTLEIFNVPKRKRNATIATAMDIVRNYPGPV